MSLGKRHIGRRVAGVGVAVSLMMLGLAAPAFAAAPAITSFTPTNGPAAGGCVLVVTGTGLDDFPAAADYDFDFVLTVAPNTVVPASDYLIISDTEAWVVAPALVAGNEYNIRATNPGGTSTSTTAFLATTGAGACAPTVASFVPNCGSAGTAVVITGTNLLMDDTATGGFAGSIGGGLVSFSPYSSDAAHTVPDVDEATSLSVVVNSGAADGPIKVTTKGTTAVPLNGLTAFSATPFLVPPPDCVPATGNQHSRSISFKIKSTGKASGKVSSTDDPAFTDCVAAVPVKIQRKTSSGWKTVGKTTTTDTGSYTKKVKNPKGKQKFRALAPKVSLGDPVTDVCLKAKSATRKV
jgi:hypothetical protein